MEDTIKVWLTGLTAIAVAATVFSSPYSGPIFTSFFGGMSKVYTSVRK